MATLLGRFLLAVTLSGNAALVASHNAAATAAYDGMRSGQLVMVL